MKIAIAMLVLGTLAAAADLSGTWKLEGDVAGMHIDRTCAIKQADNKLSGSCKNQASEATLTGAVEGQTVTWKYQADYQGIQVTVAFAGTMQSETAIAGSIDAEGAPGKFTAKKQ